MITSQRAGAQLRIVARPDQSATWRSNKLVLLALAIPSLGAALGFALAGAWPILPLAGLELTALGIALYVVNRKLQYRQVITLDGDTVTVEEGFNCPAQCWHFQRRATGLSVVPETHPWESPELTLHDRCDCVHLGEFLGRKDTLKLLELLRAEIGVRECGVQTELRV